jgi:hypothetical protein
MSDVLERLRGARPQVETASVTTRQAARDRLLALIEDEPPGLYARRVRRETEHCDESDAPLGLRPRGRRSGEASQGRLRFSAQPGRRAAWLSRLTPAIAVAATGGVIAIIILAAASHRRPSVQQESANVNAERVVPSPVSLLPARGGMRGLVFASTVVGSGSTLHVSFVQCTNCAGETTPPDSREVNWSSVSTDGGAHWRTSRDQGSSLLAFGVAAPDGADVWQSGYAPHPTDPFFYVSHDHGGTFIPAVASHNSSEGPVTLGAGEAWALGTRCIHYRCRSSVLHGAAAGSRLTLTSVQPPGMPVRRAPSDLLVAGYGRDAYVSQHGQRVYATVDDGRTWTRRPDPCAARLSILDLTATSDGSVWASCARTRRTGTSEANDPAVTIRRSDNAGKSWTTADPAVHAAAALVSISPLVAWGESEHGVLERTTNGGRSWQSVLRGVGSHPALDIQSATTATAIAIATTGTTSKHDRRTELVAYRTTNGGTRWTHTVIPLPDS